MALQYKIILISDLEGNLSKAGEQVLITSRKNNDKTKVIQCINHPENRICDMFEDGFDYLSLLGASETHTHKDALLEMKKEEWVFSEGLA
jgi:hypothetical protein